MPTIMVNGQPAEAGCYCEGHRGQYGPDHLADIAESFGIAVTRRNDPRRYRRIADYLTDHGRDDSAAWDNYIGAADDLERILNDATEGGSWGWMDGEFFLADEAGWEAMYDAY